MGASEWACFVPYQEDITKAFREAQYQEYRDHYEGKVTRQSAIADRRQWMADYFQNTEAQDEEDLQRMRAYFEERILQLEQLSEPTNIDEAIQLVRLVAAEGGTSSILDMDGISDSDDYLQITPLTSTELISLLGTDKPVRPTVEARLHDITDFRESQKGTYVIIYKDGQPDEIFFGGFSGD